ncbi:MAG TPA: hypothetical protein VN914_02285 [Polyangia bacterium]|nr:hypothetical protein [Polyangia bacterium]
MAATPAPLTFPPTHRLAAQRPWPVVALALAAAACGQPPAGDSADKVEPIPAAVSDVGFTSARPGVIRVAENGGRVLAVWEATDASGVPQLAGQLFTTGGTPLSPSRLLTSFSRGSKSPVVTAYPNPSGFFVMYDNVYSTADMDIRGMFVSIDGVVTRDFSIDFASAYDESMDAVYTESATKQVYVLYRRASLGLRAAYVDANGWVTGASAPVPPTDPGASSFAWARVAFSPGVLTLAWVRDTVPNRIIHVATVNVGATSLARPSIVAGTQVGNGTFRLTYNRSVGRFALGYPGISDGITARTWAYDCTAASCLTPMSTVLTPGNTIGDDWSFQLQAVRDGFLAVGTANGSNRIRVTRVSSSGVPTEGPTEALSPALDTVVQSSACTKDGPVFTISRSTGPTALGRRYDERGNVIAAFTIAD